MTEQDLKECIAEVKHSAIPEQSKEKIINALMENQQKSGWIPCSERLPEYDEEYYKKNGADRRYIVMNKKAYAPSVAHFTKNKLWFYNDMIEFKNVIAWQPLPEPYKEDEEE